MPAVPSKLQPGRFRHPAAGPDPARRLAYVLECIDRLREEVELLMIMETERPAEQTAELESRCPES